MNRRLGLEYLSVFGLEPVAYIEFAAALGFDFVSLNLGGAANPHPSAPRHVLRGNATLIRAISAASDAAGLAIEMIEGLTITDTTAADELVRDLDSAAALGGASVCVIAMLRDVERACDEFGRLAELARQRGLKVNTEVGVGAARTFAAASSIVRSVNDPGFTLLIDTMHFFRRDGSLEALDALGSVRIGHVQLNDVPMPAVNASYIDEALYDRRIPGQGDLPLAGFLHRLEGDVPIGLELPVRTVLADPDRLSDVIGRARHAALSLLEV